MSIDQFPWHENELDIAEVLWCAAYLDRIISVPSQQKESSLSPDTDNRPLTTSQPSRQTSSGQAKELQKEEQVKVYAQQKSGQHVSSSSDREKSSQSFSAVRIPDSFALPDPFETGKALLPFGRRVPGRRQWEIDINQTVEQTALANGLPMIVLQSELERWFDLQIFIDRSPSMEFWGDIADAFQSIFEWQGLFKNIRVWNFDTRQPQQTVLSSGTEQSARDLRSMIVPSQNRAFIVLTDTLGEAWQSGQAYHELSKLGQFHSVSIAHIFPPRMWPRTALNQAFFRTLLPGPANQANRVLAYLGESHSTDKLETFPIFSINAKHLKTWAKFTTGHSTTHQGFIYSKHLADSETPNVRNRQQQRSSPEDQLNDFYFDASDLAQELLEVLAAIPLIPPVMRLAQQRYLSKSDHSHLAEIIFSGLLRKSSFSQSANDKEDVWYEFQPRIRELVLQRSSIQDVSDIHRSISDFVEQQYNSPKDFQALIPNEQGSIISERSSKDAFFAEVRATLLVTWGGEYAQQGQALLNQVEAQRNVIEQVTSDKSTELTSDWPPLVTLTFVSAYLADPTLPDPYFPPKLYTEEFSVPNIAFTESNEPQYETLSLTFTTAKIIRRDIGWADRLFRRDSGWEIKRVVIKTPPSDCFAETLSERISLTLLKIPAGTFMMGSPENEVDRFSMESPQHPVNISQPFWLGQTPITEAQWRFACKLLEQKRPLNAPESSGRDEHPIVNVSWLEAVEFCDRLSTHTGRVYRLPTEAEWEYACRAGTETPFHFGENISPELANYYSEDSYNNGPTGKNLGATTPVGQYDSANRWGLSDMHGNVWEWCQDNWHGNYQNAPDDGSAWGKNDDKNHVCRGGSWLNSPRFCRSASRDLVSFSDYVGFRVACSAPRT